jgi:hypothetical protein
MSRGSRHVLTSYFSFGGWFYEQTDGMAVVLSLSLVIANSFMENSDEVVFIWAHGPDRLRDFLTT